MLHGRARRAPVLRPDRRARPRPVPVGAVLGRLAGAEATRAMICGLRERSERHRAVKEILRSAMSRPEGQDSGHGHPAHRKNTGPGIPPGSGISEAISLAQATCGTCGEDRTQPRPRPAAPCCSAPEPQSTLFD